MLQETNKVLFTFDSIVDIHLGLIKLIKKEYNNEKFMMKVVLDNDDLFFKSLLKSTKNKNPLLLLLNDNKKPQAESMYEAFMNKEYHNILKLAPRTSLYKLFKTYMKAGNGAINVKVLCKNELEQQYINQLDIDIPTVISNIEDVDLDLYGSVFVKNIDDLLLFKNVKGKNLFVLSYLTNYEDDNETLSVKVTIQLGEENLFNVVEIYPDIEIPVG